MARKLFIFLEGSDDERFFSAVIVPLLRDRYREIHLVLYACMKSVRVSRFIRSINKMRHDYILVADIDQEQSVRAKKSVIYARFDSIDSAHIIVIIKEIESWYLAGLDTSAAGSLGIRPLPGTDSVTKEDFNRRIPRKYPSRIAFMIQCLRHFSLDVAMTKNRSFRFFLEKYRLSPASAFHGGGHGEVSRSGVLGGRG
jgi:hypothetical protein